MGINPEQVKVLDPKESYTFSKYFDLPFSIQYIMADLGYQFARSALTVYRVPDELAQILAILAGVLQETD